ncbi:MAG: VOC family protein [Chloroflexi bacterium]|nr:VOC family protein [Chloroflexota bacterium]
MLGNGIVHELAAVTLDVNDLEREAAFWGEMFGEQPGPVRGGGGWVTVGTLSGDTSLVLQKVPELKVVKNRAHMCFLVTDVDEAISRIVGLGGGQISEPRVGGGVTMADPEGNEFCVGAFRRTKEGVRIPL